MRTLLITMLAIGIGCVHAQTSSSKEIKIYKRYENGELVEDRLSVIENGVQIEGQDFDLGDLGSAFGERPQGSFDMRSFDMGSKMAEMEQRMKDIQARADAMFAGKMADMERKMAEIQQRVRDKQAEIQGKIDGQMNGIVQPQSRPERPTRPQIKPSNQPSVRPVTGVTV